MRIKTIVFIRTLCPIKKPAAQTAHLVFADTQAKAKKPKELFSANHRHRINYKKCKQQKKS